MKTLESTHLLTSMMLITQDIDEFIPSFAHDEYPLQHVSGNELPSRVGPWRSSFKSKKGVVVVVRFNL